MTYFICKKWGGDLGQLLILSRSYLHSCVHGTWARGVFWREGWKQIRTRVYRQITEDEAEVALYSCIPIQWGQQQQQQQNRSLKNKKKVFKKNREIRFEPGPIDWTEVEAEVALDSCMPIHCWEWDPTTKRSPRTFQDRPAFGDCAQQRRKKANRRETPGIIPPLSQNGATKIAVIRAFLSPNTSGGLGRRRKYGPSLNFREEKWRRGGKGGWLPCCGYDVGMVGGNRPTAERNILTRGGVI